MEKVLYKNDAHEAQLRQEFEWCRGNLQKVVDLYNGMEIVKCDDTPHLYDLLHDTSGRVRLDLILKSRNTGNVVEYDRLNLQPLLAQVAKCKQFSEFIKKERAIFRLEDGKVTADTAAAKIIEAQRIVARSQRQVEFYEKLKQFELLFNEIDGCTGGELLRERRHRTAWSQIFDMPINAAAPVARIPVTTYRAWINKV